MSSTEPPPRNRQLWCRSAAKIGKSASSLRVGADGPSPLPWSPWRSEERRVGKECRSRWSPYHSKKKKTVSESAKLSGVLDGQNTTFSLEHPRTQPRLAEA